MRVVVVVIFVCISLLACLDAVLIVPLLLRAVVVVHTVVVPIALHAGLALVAAVVGAPWGRHSSASSTSHTPCD